VSNRRRTTTAHHVPYETDMTEWRRTKLRGDGAGLAEIEVVPRHRIDPGHAGTYDVPATRLMIIPVAFGASGSPALI